MNKTNTNTQIKTHTFTIKAHIYIKSYKNTLRVTQKHTNTLKYTHTDKTLTQTIIHKHKHTDIYIQSTDSHKDT